MVYWYVKGYQQLKHAYMLTLFNPDVYIELMDILNSADRNPQLYFS